MFDLQTIVEHPLSVGLPFTPPHQAGMSTEQGVGKGCVTRVCVSMGSSSGTPAWGLFKTQTAPPARLRFLLCLSMASMPLTHFPWELREWLSVLCISLCLNTKWIHPSRSIMSQVDYRHTRVWYGNYRHRRGGDGLHTSDASSEHLTRSSTRRLHRKHSVALRAPHSLSLRLKDYQQIKTSH